MIVFNFVPSTKIGRDLPQELENEVERVHSLVRSRVALVQEVTHGGGGLSEVIVRDLREQMVSDVTCN